MMLTDRQSRTAMPPGLPFRRWFATYYPGSRISSSF